MNKIKLLIVLLLLAITNSNAQVVTLDYSSFTSSSCDAFENFTTFQGILHQTKRGDITKNSSQGGLELKYDYFTGGTNQKGSEFALSGITFKKDFKYIVKITAKNNGSYSEPAGLKCNFNPNNIDLGCNGVNTVNPNNNTFGIISSDWFQTVNGTAFVEYTFTSDYLITALSSLGIGTFSRFNISSSTNFLQTIYIKKIEIFEIAPPPSFSLSPTSISLVCGDVSARTFTVTPANIPSGATVTYQWSYSGWSGTVNSTMSSVTLTPNSGLSLPPNVSVTPLINGVAQTSQICSVARNPMTIVNPKISDGSICTVGTSKTYYLPDVPGLAGSGNSNTVSWSTTNTAIATVASNTKSQVVIQSQSIGTFKIEARVTNICGEFIIILSNTINVGLGSVSPVLEGTNCSSVGSAPCVINDFSHNSSGTYVSLTSPTMETEPVTSDWEWENISGRFTFSGTYANGNVATGKSLGINFINGIIPNQIEFRARVKNSCGLSAWKNFILNFSDGVPPVVVTPPTTPTEYYNISPNPASSYVNITLKNSSIVPPNTGNLYVSVYTTSGSVVINETYMNGNTGGSLYIGGLPSYTGYLLKIRYNNNVVETKYLMKN